MNRQPTAQTGPPQVPPASLSPVSIYDFPAVDSLFRQGKIDPGLLRRLRAEFFKRAKSEDDALACLPVDLAERLRGRIRFRFSETVDTRESAVDRVTKTVHRLDNGRIVESVLMRPKTGRVSLCISTQSGCAVGCRFCETGGLRPVGDLTCDEILDQVRSANMRLLPERLRVRNVVFMGMGEPLLNERAVHAAVGVLIDPRGFNLAPRHVTVSTVGIAGGIERLVAAFPDVSPAISLHAARDEVRDAIIPFTKKATADELRRTIATITAGTPRRVFVECLLLRGVNDSDADLDALLAWADGLQVHFNLMPYNAPPADEEPESAELADSAAKTRPRYEPASAERIARFSETLKSRGIATTTRYSQGQDIAAACGQLAGRLS